MQNENELFNFDNVQVVRPTFGLEEEQEEKEIELPNFDEIKIIKPTFEVPELLEQPDVATNPLTDITIEQIEEDDNFVRNEEERLKQDPGLTTRFVSSFIEGLSPLPVDITSDYQAPDTLSEKVAGIAGQVAGFGTGLFMTGGGIGGL